LGKFNVADNADQVGHMQSITTIKEAPLAKPLLSEKRFLLSVHPGASCPVLNFLKLLGVFFFQLGKSS
jgi:hypothetical protein